MPRDRAQIERRVPVDDHLERLRDRLEPVAADPEAETGRGRFLRRELHHRRVRVDPGPPAERASQLAQPLTTASTDIQHSIAGAKVAPDDLLVIPRHRLPQLAHGREVPAAPVPDHGEKLIHGLLRAGLAHEPTS